MENQEVNLQCSAIGNPTPKITWIKDGEEVDRGNKLSFKALRSQSGRYWCLAQNGLEDSVNASAYLDVQCEYKNNEMKGNSNFEIQFTSLLFAQGFQAFFLKRLLIGQKVAVPKKRGSKAKPKHMSLR